MKPEDPYIPKKQAARLRTSYGRVSAGRDKIAYIEAKGRDILLELEEYERDPATYALLRYPSVPDPLAYPTVTHVERLRYWLDDKASKIPAYHEALLFAEAQMEHAEAEVLAAVRAMRVSTSGREPWPARPATLQALRRQWEKDYAKNRKAGARIREKHRERRAQDAERDAAARRAFTENMASEVALHAAAMPAGKAVAYVAMMEALQERLLGDPASLADFYDIAQGQSTIITQVIAEARDRTIERLGGEGNAAAET